MLDEMKIRKKYAEVDFGVPTIRITKATPETAAALGCSKVIHIYVDISYLKWPYY